MARYVNVCALGNVPPADAPADNNRAILQMIDFNRDKLNAAKAKYGNQVGIAVPDYLGSVLLTSESEAFTVRDVMKEFEITPWREYYAASEKHREANL